MMQNNTLKGGREGGFLKERISESYLSVCFTDDSLLNGGNIYSTIIPKTRRNSRIAILSEEFSVFSAAALMFIIY